MNIHLYYCICFHLLKNLNKCHATKTMTKNIDKKYICWDVSVIKIWHIVQILLQILLFHIVFRRVLIIIILPTIPLHSWYNLFLPPLFPASHSVGTNVISVYERLSPKLPHGCALIEAIFCQMRFLCLFSSVLPSLLQHIKNIACRFQTKLLWQR